jgi:hypothetical protein
MAMGGRAFFQKPADNEQFLAAIRNEIDSDLQALR